MTGLTKVVRRLVDGLVVELVPATQHEPASVVIREPRRRRTEVRLPIGRLFTREHRERAGLALRPTRVRSRRTA